MDAKTAIKKLSKRQIILIVVGVALVLIFVSYLYVEQFKQSVNTVAEELGIPVCTPNYDVNGDGKVNFQDSGLVFTHINLPYDPKYDMNCDGIINQEDYTICWDHHT
jgi:flagellar basal body-associated protein FliL